MPGSFEWSGGDESSGLASLGTPTGVFRFDADAGELYRLPNLEWETIQYRQGAEIPAATLRYLLDDSAVAQGWPSQFEDLWPTTAAGEYVVQPDDRVCIYGWTPDGQPRVLFDGFAQQPQVDISGGSQGVRIQAVGAAARLWDLPIGGRWMRDADSPSSTTNGLIHTDLPTRFNPTDKDGLAKPNCSPDGYDEGQGEGETAFPVFIDPDIHRDPDPRRYWNLSGAVRYLLAKWNNEDYVKNPDFGSLDELLMSRAPLEGAESYDPSDSSTFTETEITLRDYDATNKTLPDALGELLGYSGFGMGYRLELDGDGLPVNRIEIYRLDAGAKQAPKPVWFDRQGTDLDPERNSIVSLNLTRDMTQVVNAFTVETQPRRVELSVVLAPGFTPTAGDETKENRGQFLNSARLTATDEVLKKYRYYVADECGDGHYDYDTSTFVTGTTLDLSTVFLPRDDTGERTYAVRHRPGRNTMISLDGSGQPRKAALAYSFNYAGPVASVWDGSGDWQTVSGGFVLLHDRLGINLTIEDVEEWFVAKPGKKLNGVTWQANPPTGKRFFLRLTTVIDDDVTLRAINSRRASSPTKFTRRRRIDARDHFEHLGVHPSSPNYAGEGGEIDVIRDDSEKATAHADALRAAREFPPLAGSMSFPYLTNAYRIGDLIDRIEGREVDLRSNAGDAMGEGANYPAVVSIQWVQSDRGQSTVIQLSDHRSEPQHA